MNKKIMGEIKKTEKSIRETAKFISGLALETMTREEAENKILSYLKTIQETNKHMVFKSRMILITNEIKREGALL